MKYILFAFALIIVFGAASGVYYVYFSDPVDKRYDTMSIGMEDHCKANTSGDKCRAFGECYRSGIEQALPREIVRGIIDGKVKQADIPPDVERSVRDLEKACGTKVGLNVAG